MLPTKSGRRVHYMCPTCGLKGSIVFNEHDEPKSEEAIYAIAAEHEVISPLCSEFGFQLVLENGTPV